MALKIILIHGLNNNVDCFIPLRDQFRSMGYTTEILCLPGHGDNNRDEARNFETALESFEQDITKLIEAPYVVIAFSQGALYLQLWLEQNNRPLPLAQVLLAPALYIRHFGKLDKIMAGLPAFTFILSQMPRKLRRYYYLHVWEYRTLFNKAKMFQKLNTPMRVPTLILIDPKDEVVDAQKLKSELDSRNSGAEVVYYMREYLKGRRPGKYHILFHPDFFTKDDWAVFVSKIGEFIKRFSSEA